MLKTTAGITRNECIELFKYNNNQQALASNMSGLGSGSGLQSGLRELAGRTKRFKVNREKGQQTEGFQQVNRLKGNKWSTSPVSFCTSSLDRPTEAARKHFILFLMFEGLATDWYYLQQCFPPKVSLPGSILST